MHKKANKIRDEIGYRGWHDDAKNSVEEKVYRKTHHEKS